MYGTHNAFPVLNLWYFTAVLSEVCAHFPICYYYYYYYYYSLSDLCRVFTLNNPETNHVPRDYSVAAIL